MSSSHTQKHITFQINTVMKQYQSNNQISQQVKLQIIKQLMSKLSSESIVLYPM